MLRDGQIDSLAFVIVIVFLQYIILTNNDNKKLLTM